MHFKIDSVLDLMKHASGFVNAFPASLFPLCFITAQWFFFSEAGTNLRKQNTDYDIFA